MTLNYRTRRHVLWATASSRILRAGGIQGRGRGQTGLQLDHHELLGRLNAASNRFTESPVPPTTSPSWWD